MVVQRVQDAFARGGWTTANSTSGPERRLPPGRMRTWTPCSPTCGRHRRRPSQAPVVPGPGRYAIALKSSVRRAGRWRVPERYTTVVYKGGGWLDLRAAELTGPVTTFLAVAYKSRVTILVPPNVRVEMTGLGVSQDAHDEDPGYRLPARPCR